MVSLRDLLGRRPTAQTNALVRVGFGRSWSSSDWGYTRTLNSVLANATAYRCVETVVNNMARPPWQTRRPGSDEAVGHDLLDVLNRPGPDMSGTAMQRFMARDLELTGKSIWMRVQGRDGFGDAGPLTGLRRLPVERVTVFGNDDDELVGFVYRNRSGMITPFLPEAVVYLRYPHPARAYDGLAPALLAGLGAETDTASARFNFDLLANDGALPGYLTVENLSPEQFREWKAEWEAGATPGRTRFMSGNATYHKVGQTNQELTYNELRAASQGDVYKSFGVPRVIIEPQDATFANARQAKALFFQQRILPAVVLMGDDLTVQLDAGVDVGFDLSVIEELNEGLDTLVDRSIKLLDRNAVTINEVRERMRLAPVAWGDAPTESKAVVDAPTPEPTAFPPQKALLPARAPQDEPDPGADEQVRLRRFFEAQGAVIAARLRGQAGKAIAKATDPALWWDRERWDRDLRLVTTKALDVNATTEAALKALVIDAAAEGLSVDGIAERVESYFVTVSEQKASSAPRATDARVSPSGAMVAVFLEPEIAALLAIEGGEPVDSLHLTLAYLGDAADGDREAVAQAVATFAATAPPLDGQVAGLVRLGTIEDGHVAGASVDLPGLPEWRGRLVAALEAHGVKVDATHSYSPHVTLAYLQPGDATPAMPEPLVLHFDTITLAWGADRQTFALTNPEDA